MLAPVPGAPGGGAARGSPVGASSAGPAASPAGVTAALSPGLASAVLGSHLAGLVTNLTTGQVLFAQDAAGPFAPASTAKLAVAVAALDVLGPGDQLRTRVVAGRKRDAIVLVGGGDPTLAAGPPPATDYPQPATLASLAASTATALRARHTGRVWLSYDTSLFTGPGSGLATEPRQHRERSRSSRWRWIGRLTASGTAQDPRRAHSPAPA